MAPKTSLVSLFDLVGVDSLRQKLRVDPQALRQLRNALFKRFATDEEALSQAPAAVRDLLRESLEWHPLELSQRVDSQRDGASKLLFRTSAGQLIETVILRIATGRTTLCLSSQVGCAAACEFCATGKMGIARNLSRGEILDQAVQAGQLLAKEGRRIRNLVFMGMGEPFHNEEQLYAALSTLIAPEAMHHPPGRILVSTVGLPAAMVRCAARFPDVKLALSLHSVRPATRQSLVPLARKYPLDDLRRAILQVNRIQGEKTSVMIEHLMLADLNDSLEEALELAAWLKGLRVHVNLIPYNPIDDAPHLAPTPRRQRDAFAQILRSDGLPTTIRYSLGADVAAACGQLVRRSSGTKAPPQ